MSREQGINRAYPLPLTPYPQLIFFGSDDFSLPVLVALHKAGWEIKAVVTKPDSPAGRGRQLRPPVTKAWAEEHGIPVLQPDGLSDTEPKLNHFGVQLGVVASYGKLIPDSLLDLFPIGLVNVHPSLLPKYRGPSPIQAAILNGDAQTGVSLIKLTGQMDAGPIYAQEAATLSGTETQPQLYEQLAQLGARMLVEHLPGIASGKLSPVPQDETQASVTHLIGKADGQVDWTQPAEQIERQIRAYLSWPGSRTAIQGKDVLITKAHVAPSTDARAQPGSVEIIQPAGIIRVTTGSGSLCIDQLKPAGKRQMTAAEFLAGLR